MNGRINMNTALRTERMVYLSFLLAVFFFSSTAFAMTCTSDSTKTINLGSSELISVSCSGMQSGETVEVTHSGYNPGCLSSSTASKTLTYAAPSATFAFDGLSSACQGNVAERTIGWLFDDGTNVYSSSTVVTLSPVEITAAFSSSSISKNTLSGTFYITFTVSNTGTSSISSVAVSETTGTGILSSKEISSIPAQSFQSVSWPINPASVGAGVYHITAKALGATTDPATDSMTLTITDGGSGDDDGGNDGGSSGGSGGGGGGGGASENKKNVTHKPTPPGLVNNTKLQAAIEKVLAKGKLNQNAIDNLMRLSSAIAGESTISRAINSGASKSNVTTKIKYGGAKTAKNYVVYEKVPKSFANSSDLITVTAVGAKVEIVEKDPEYAILFDTVNPNQELEIIYSVNKAVSTNTVDSFASEVYAESVAETQQQQACAQVITPAKNRATGECKEFATPCDVPSGWDKVDSCKTAGTSQKNITKENNEPLSESGFNIVTIIVVLLITLIVIVVGYHFFKKKNEAF